MAACLAGTATKNKRLNSKRDLNIFLTLYKLYKPCAITSNVTKVPWYVLCNTVNRNYLSLKKDRGLWRSD